MIIEGTNETIRKIRKPSPRGRTQDGGPNPIDVYVGKRIRMRRESMKLSQERLGQLIGITFQQIQKYERGMNRISASRIYDISQILCTPITYFFAEMDEETAMQSPRRFIISCKEFDDIIPELHDPMQKAEALELITAFNKIGNQKTALAVRELIVALSHNASYGEI